MPPQRRIPVWACTALLSILLVLLLKGVSVAIYYAGDCERSMSPFLGGIAAALLGAFFAVLNSQTVGSRSLRSRVSPWWQVFVGAVMTVAQVLALSAIFLVARTVLSTVTLSGGLFMIAATVAVAFVPLVLLAIWQLGWAWGGKLFETVSPKSVGFSPKLSERSSSQLVGVPFWSWLATFFAAIGLIFGLDERLAPYPLIGVSPGVYLTTFSVLLFVLSLYQTVALYLRNRAREHMRDK